MAEAVIGGVRIHYEISGHGHPLVLTTGQGTGPEARAELIAGLARDHAVLTYDQRGTGRSERVAQGQPIETLAEDIVAIMDAAGVARAHVVGHSTGTGMATVLAARHPARVARLVLAAPWTHGDPFLQAVQAMRMAAARTMPPDHHAQLNAAIIYPPDYRRAHAGRFAAMAAKALDAPQDAAGIAARLTAILAFDARPLYPRIACPTLVMAARDDQIMPGWFAEEAARAVPGAQLQILEGGGHMFPETRTAEFLQRVGAFLR
jgi:aminoacrylate hydrolase